MRSGVTLSLCLDLGVKGAYKRQLALTPADLVRAVGGCPNMQVFKMTKRLPALTPQDGEAREWGHAGYRLL